jgi:hypothetical protein
MRFISEVVWANRPGTIRSVWSLTQGDDLFNLLVMGELVDELLVPRQQLDKKARYVLGISIAKNVAS